MKYNIMILVIVFGLMQSHSQHIKQISLKELDSSLYTDIKLQGKKLYRKSHCLTKTEKYVIIPQFYVESTISLDSLHFQDSDFLLRNLYFSRSSKRKFLKDVSWQLIDSKDNDKFSSSDRQRFYCYDAPPSAFDYVFVSIQKIGIDNIKYFFYIGRTDGFLQFIVDDDGKVYAYHSKIKKWFSLSEFNEFYENGGIERFSDNLFKD